MVMAIATEKLLFVGWILREGSLRYLAAPRCGHGAARAGRVA
jgi:hypothetical protein